MLDGGGEQLDNQGTHPLLEQKGEVLLLKWTMTGVTMGHGGGSHQGMVTMGYHGGHQGLGRGGVTRGWGI